jgi:signal transduction histidine kinase
MHTLHSILDWFSGGSNQYHRLSMCMQEDTFWIAVTVILCVLVAVGYIIIAYHWSRNERSLPQSPARTALRTMRNIFVFCGLCGYVFVPVKMVWPAWRLYDLFMVGLVFYTWRYALNALNFKVIYTAIGRSGQLAEDLAKSQDESKRKTFFLNAISHDLRTPLNGMLLHANLAEIHVAADDRQAVQQSISEIKASVRLTADLLDGLLEYARLETSADHAVASDFSLDDLLSEVHSSHHALATRKSIVLNKASPCGLTLMTDRLRLERILNNLVGNAIKFTPSGSVSIEVESTSQQVKISVVDTGIGIAPEHQKCLFEEFFQVQNHERDRQKGFGLGLAISNRLVHQLGGELHVHSTPGEGSRFSILVPAILPAERSDPTNGQPAVQHSKVARESVSADRGR